MTINPLQAILQQRELDNPGASPLDDEEDEDFQRFLLTLPAPLREVALSNRDIPSTPFSSTGRSVPVPKDVGFLGALKHGFVGGLLDPLKVVGVDGPTPVELDETHEKVGNFLGSLGGLGISFIPFGIAGGAVLRGAGLASRLTTVVNGQKFVSPMYGFIRNTLAGSAQFAGSSESLEEVPRNLVEGAVFGAAIEGFFLSRAMKGRAQALNNAKAAEHLSGLRPPEEMTIATANLNPPEDMVRALKKELELSPTDGKSSSRIARELDSLGKDDFTYNEAIVDLAEEHVSSVWFPGLANADDVVRMAREKLPSAQILVRATKGGRKDVLVHNPLFSDARLTPKQEAQFKASGLIEGQEVLYWGTSYKATGVPVADGRIQLQAIDIPSLVIEPKANEITRPTSFRIFNKSQEKLKLLAEASKEGENQIGFIIPAATVKEGAKLRAKRGLVDTTNYKKVESLDEFIEELGEDFFQVEGFGTREEAIEALALQRNIKGLIIEDSGVIREVKVFDQNTVNYVREVPKVGLYPDNAITSVAVEGGKTKLHSFQPSWKNSLESILRSKGVPEKGINELIDVQRLRVQKQLELIMDDEFLSAVNASRAQYTGGCL